MNDNIISSDHALTTAQQEILSALADAIVPASDDGALPSAGDLDVGTHVSTFHDEYLADLKGVLAHFEGGFSSLDLATRVEQVNVFSEDSPGLFRGLLTHVYACYYQDDRVLDAIGVGKGAPFPRGNEVESGDLSLLDPVADSTITWRRV